MTDPKPPEGILQALTGPLLSDVLQEEARVRYAALRHAKEVLGDGDGYMPDERMLDLFEFAEYIRTGRRPWSEDYDRVPPHEEGESVEFRNMAGEVTRVYQGDTPPVKIVSQGRSVRPASESQPEPDDDPGDDFPDFD